MLTKPNQTEYISPMLSTKTNDKRVSDREKERKEEMGIRDEKGYKKPKSFDT